MWSAEAWKLELGRAPLDGVRPWPWWMGRPAVDSPVGQVVDGGSQQAARVERRSERRPVLVTRFRWIAGCSLHPASVASEEETSSNRFRDRAAVGKTQARRVSERVFSPLCHAAASTCTSIATVPRHVFLRRPCSDVASRAEARQALTRQPLSLHRLSPQPPRRGPPTADRRSAISSSRCLQSRRLSWVGVSEAANRRSCCSRLDTAPAPILNASWPIAA